LPVLSWLCVGSGLLGGLGLLIGLGLLTSDRRRGLKGDGDVASLKPRKSPLPAIGMQPNIGLDTSDLANLEHQFFPSGHRPTTSTKAGTLAGLNNALHGLGLPGLGPSGTANDGGKPEGTNIPPQEGYDNGGYIVTTGGGWNEFYAYDDSSRSSTHLVAVLNKEDSKAFFRDPIRDEDGTNEGATTLPLDGTGHVRPHGDVLDLQNSGLSGPPADLHGELKNLANLNENASLGNSSGPGTHHDAATDPSSDSDAPADGSLDDMKQILDSNEAVVDPSPEHPKSNLGSSAGEEVP
jgi:hypothetical protein